MLSIPLLGAVVLLSQQVSAGSGYSYVCNDDGSVVVSNLPPTSVSFFAYQGSTVCPTSGDYNAVTITGCSKDSPIVLAHSTYVNMSSNLILGGTQLETINVKCTEISAVGVAFSFGFTMIAPNMTISANVTLSPTYEISSALNVSSANVGDPILWTINYPSGYYLEITNCKAYSGTSSGSTFVDLVNYWCTETTDLLSNFVWTLSGSGIAVSVIKAFKFYNNNAVFLYCDVRICPIPGACMTVCMGKKKRSLAEQSSADDGSRQATIGTYFQIIDPDPYSDADVNVSRLLLLPAAVMATRAY